MPKLMLKPLPSLPVLLRTCLREAGGQFAAYAGIFLALMLVGIGTPLVKQGAPPGAVATFLIEQIPLFSVLALPLGLVTAILVTLGRMREEGELTALMAAGIPTWRVARSFLPLAVLLALWIGLSAHVLLPVLAQHAIAGRDDLMRQAIAAQVARRAPVVSNDDVVLSANALRGDELHGVFAAQTLRDGTLYLCYAPEARLVAAPEDLDYRSTVPGRATVAGIELHDARLLVREPARDGQPSRVTTALLPVLAVPIPGPSADFSRRPELLRSGVLREEIASLRAKLSPAGQTGLSAATISDHRRRLSELERAWHIRLMLPVGIFAHWIFACGLGLCIGRGNRLLSAVLGIAVVVGTFLPAYGLAKEAGEALHLDAGIFVWAPVLLIGVLGAWLTWRRR